MISVCIVLYDISASSLLHICINLGHYHIIISSTKHIELLSLLCSINA